MYGPIRVPGAIAIAESVYRIEKRCRDSVMKNAPLRAAAASTPSFPGQGTSSGGNLSGNRRRRKRAGRPLQRGVG
jgi:hypothetical protein